MDIKKNMLVFEANAQSFESVFGLNLRDYFSFTTGFEIVSFCSDVLKGHPQDWEFEVRARYDQEGVDIIKCLLGIMED